MQKGSISEHNQEAPSCPVGQGSFKMECFNSGKVFNGQTSPNLTFLLEITDAVSSEIKRRRPSSVFSVQFISDGMGVHKCIRYGRLHVLEGTMNAESYIAYRAAYAPLQTMCISTGQCKTTTELLQQHGFVVEESRAELACLQPRSFTYREHLA